MIVSREGIQSGAQSFGTARLPPARCPHPAEARTVLQVVTRRVPAPNTPASPIRGWRLPTLIACAILELEQLQQLGQGLGAPQVERTTPPAWRAVHELGRWSGATKSLPDRLRSRAWRDGRRIPGMGFTPEGTRCRQGDDGSARSRPPHAGTTAPAVSTGGEHTGSPRAPQSGGRDRLLR